MNINNLFKKNFSKTSIPYYFPIILGIIYKLNGIALFIIPLQAINSISKQKLNPRLKEVLEIFKFPLPSDNNLFIFFFILILLTLSILIVSNILKKFFVLRIKKEIFYSNEKNINNKENINYYTKKFGQVNYYITNTEDIIFCSLLVLIIFFVDYQIALITLLGGTSYYLVVTKLRLLRVRSKKEILESIVSNNKKNPFSLIIKQFSNDQKLSKSIGSGIIMLIILFAVYKRSDPAISIIFIFLVRIFQNQMIQSLNKFISRKEKILK